MVSNPSLASITLAPKEFAVVRRRIAILLLILLPLQFTWNVAAAYCQHESGAASRHFGHHVHVHHAAQASKAEASPSSFDADCPGCAHVDGPALTPGWPVVKASEFQFAPAAAEPRAPPAPPPTRPDRPNWTSPV